MKKLPILLILSLCSFTLFSQEKSTNTNDTLRKHAINVYMDDAPSYLKKEVPFINYVRDKNVADLIIIETMQETGSRGAELTFFIEGQFKYAGVMDTAKFYVYPGETKEQVRSRGVRVFKMALMKYIVETPLAEFINITFTEPISEEVSSDKWNNWVFSTNIHGSLNGQETSKSDLRLTFNRYERIALPLGLTADPDKTKITRKTIRK
ncbi:hypothetical protein ES705_24324 [subsurface metagenome]